MECTLTTLMQSYEYLMDKRAMLNRNNHGATFIAEKSQQGKCESASNSWRSDAYEIFL